MNRQTKKKLRIEVELDYPSCDIYPAEEVIEFVHEHIQDWLNANLSDGDNRLKLTNLTVTSDNIKKSILK